MSTNLITPASPTLAGHPTGLFTLFFAEMWERFSYYGMRALLVFYMIKGFMRYGDTEAYAVYGAYTALVYMTPFFGGMLADRVLGARRAVILGGLLMAAGHLMMTIENNWAFFTALSLLICGNGFFKPNISTIVGSLYPPGSAKRDGGFTIFYMGINLGAAMSPLLCGYIGETYGWHYGFGLATIGMLAGVAIFVAPSIVSQTTMFLLSIAATVNVFVVPFMFPESTWIPMLANFGLLGMVTLAGIYALMELGWAELRESLLSKTIAWIVLVTGAVVAAFLLLRFWPDNPFSMWVNILVAVSLLIAAAVACAAIYRGGLPKEAGAAPDAKWLRRGLLGIISPEWITYLATIAGVALFVLLVSGFAPLTEDNRGITLIDDQWIEDFREPGGAVREVTAVVLRESSRPAGLVLMLSGLLATAYIFFETFRLDRIPRHRMYVVIVLTAFSMLFWSFFEQAGSSVNNFTDRNVDRVTETERITEEDVGTTILIQPTQEQLGFSNGDQLFTLDVLDGLRERNKDNPAFEIPWEVTEGNIGMGIGQRKHEVPASTFQSVNPIFIMVFGLVFTALWAVLASRGLEPSTPVKFALGLVQLGFGFGAFWYGAVTADERGMVFLGWLMLGYLFQTTAELCLSPVGLSMITKLSPARLVSTVMGGWFLATAFSLFVAAIIAQFTGVTHGGNGEGSTIPIPSETVGVYGSVFGKIAIWAIISGVICLAISPLLKYWMHAGADMPVEAELGDEPDQAAG
jgi:POT family proton-dependent oligopeptide transporter